MGAVPIFKIRRNFIDGTRLKQARILLLSVSAGSGHVRAAEALHAYAALHFPQLEMRHQDLMQMVPLAFRKIYTDFYLALASRLPEAWGWLYRKTDHAPEGGWIDAIRRLLQNLCTRQLLKEVDHFAPDAIICTHFLPAELLSAAKRKGRLTCPVWVQVTDFDVHRMWVHEGISGYFVANEELAFRLQAYGIAAEHIHVTGIPVMPAFSTHQERQTCARQFGLQPQAKTVLLMGGGAGIGGMEMLAAKLLEFDQQLQLIVMAGKNRSLLTALETLALRYPSRLLAVGFTDQVPALMSCADIAITKPGGLSTSECLVMGLPMVLINPIPGQEERNADFLLQEGVALRADDPVTLRYRLQCLLTHPSGLMRMRERALALAKPDAARALLQQVNPFSSKLPT